MQTVKELIMSKRFAFTDSLPSYPMDWIKDRFVFKAVGYARKLYAEGNTVRYSLAVASKYYQVQYQDTKKYLAQSMGWEEPNTPVVDNSKQNSFIRNIIKRKSLSNKSNIQQRIERKSLPNQYKFFNEETNELIKNITLKEIKEIAEITNTIKDKESGYAFVFFKLYKDQLNKSHVFPIQETEDGNFSFDGIHHDPYADL